MSKIKNYMMDIQEQVWDFFDQDGNFVAKEVSFDNKVQKINTKEEMIKMFAIVHGLMAAKFIFTFKFFTGNMFGCLGA